MGPTVSQSATTIAPATDVDSVREFIFASVRRSKRGAVQSMKSSNTRPAQRTSVTAILQRRKER
jgi:hypothetical protein